MNNKNRYMPIMLALCVVFGILIGTFYANHFSGNRLNIINSGSNRLNNLLHIIDDRCGKENAHCALATGQQMQLFLLGHGCTAFATSEDDGLAALRNRELTL